MFVKQMYLDILILVYIFKWTYAHKKMPRYICSIKLKHLIFKNRREYKIYSLLKCLITWYSGTIFLQIFLDQIYIYILDQFTKWEDNDVMSLAGMHTCFKLCLLKFKYSLRSIILFANIDVSRHILVIDTSVFAKSNMGQREYQICIKCRLQTTIDYFVIPKDMKFFGGILLDT
jgi:hypothetical protein